MTDLTFTHGKSPDCEVCGDREGDVFACQKCVVDSIGQQLILIVSTTVTAIALVAGYILGSGVV